MAYEQHLLRQSIRKAAREAREHGVVHDDAPRVREIGARGATVRENALFDDQAGCPVIGFAVIGTMTCGKPEV